MRSTSTPPSNRRTRRLASRRSRRRPVLLAGGLVVGVLAAAALTGTAASPSVAATTPSLLTGASFQLAAYTTPVASAPEVAEARSAVAAAVSSTQAADTVEGDIAASGLDIGQPVITVDTAALEQAAERLDAAAQQLPATFLPEITDSVTELSASVDAQVSQLRGSLDGALAKKAEEEAAAAEKARLEAEAAAAAKAKAEEEAAQAEAQAVTRTTTTTTTRSSGSTAAPSAPLPVTGSSGDNSPAGAQASARGMLGNYGWGEDQMSCLVSLWNKESGWNYQAYNSGSGAFGIPQALPGSKMASAGADWQTNAATQVAWGLGYISGRYGSPCSAWSHSQSVGWY
ncbi:lytic transglycosylase domain-containing protein [Microbacterium enclense]|uniref:aggregation-promoting factor C-terminal-like domain-containing protein n=1 Tax=Microbacterium enclense TaxID=993073 RepID=UPI0036D79713